MTMPAAESTALAEILRRERPRILRRFELVSTPLASSARETVRAVRNTVPRILDELISAAEDPAAHGTGDPLSNGWDLREVLEEIATLRTVASVIVAGADGAQAAALQAAFDALTLRVVDDAEVRRRATAASLDEIAEAAFATPTLDGLLARLADLPRSASNGIDAVVIYLLEGDSLCVRAASGLGVELTSSVVIPVGEGLAGTIAKSREPLEVDAANGAGLLRADVVRAIRPRCVYGVPLLHGSQLLGVAHVASVRLPSIAPGDKRLVREFASRAATAIVQARLRARLDEERDDLVNAIAHDLKTPLQAMGGFAELLRARREKAGDDEEVGWLKKMESHVERMNRLLTDLLDVRLLANRRLPVQVQRFDLTAILSDVVAQWTAGTPDHRFVLDAPPLEVLGDRLRIAQVLGNLLSNAVKYSPAGSEVLVCAEARGDWARVSVVDQGIGVPTEQRAKLFRRYQRVPGAEAVAKGYGIGLYVSAELVRAMGGAIGVESAPGKGSTFWFMLPIAR